jgi:CheY-like chemotaxis protein
VLARDSDLPTLCLDEAPGQRQPQSRAPCVFARAVSSCWNWTTGSIRATGKRIELRACQVFQIVAGTALAAGFVDHLVKPLDPEALCLAVARAHRR